MYREVPLCCDSRGAHSEIDGNHEIDLTASTDVVSERVQRNCPVQKTTDILHAL